MVREKPRRRVLWRSASKRAALRDARPGGWGAVVLLDWFEARQSLDGGARASHHILIAPGVATRSPLPNGRAGVPATTTTGVTAPTTRVGFVVAVVSLMAARVTFGVDEQLPHAEGPVRK